MRKYQQVALLLISCISIVILLNYKSENNRLKYVLQVVNFFGRNDSANLKGLTNFANDEQLDHAELLPVWWQAIGGGFHAYTSFWNRNELVAGGEAITIVTGERQASVHFSCSFFFDSGTRKIEGKFHFKEVGNISGQTNIDFKNYNFYCRLPRDFGQPDSVGYTNLVTTKTISKLRLNHPGKADKNASYTPHLATICLDLASSNSATLLAKDPNNLVQFFLNHYIFGIQDFIVYNGDAIPQSLIQLIHRIRGVRVQLLPFNFPFAREKATEQLFRIVETDCLMRSVNIARYTMVLAANEFFYANTMVNDRHSILHSLHRYDAQISRFELPIYAVCIDHSSNLLVDNTLYDPKIRHPHRLFIYRLSRSSINEEASPRSIALPVSVTLVHRYVYCLDVAKDNLKNWRNSLHEDFMQHIKTIRDEVKLLI